MRAKDRQHHINMVCRFGKSRAVAVMRGGPLWIRRELGNTREQAG